MIEGVAKFGYFMDEESQLKFNEKMSEFGWNYKTLPELIREKELNYSKDKEIKNGSKFWEKYNR